MRRPRDIFRNRDGLAAAEFAIIAPILITLIWGIFQLALVFEANAGVQSALGNAARYATIFPTPSDDDIKAKVVSSRFGGAQGTWGAPTIVTDDAAGTKTITVSYSQPLNFLFFNGPNITLTKSKVVYLSN